MLRAKEDPGHQLATLSPTSSRPVLPCRSSPWGCRHVDVEPQPSPSIHSLRNWRVLVCHPMRRLWWFAGAGSWLAVIPGGCGVPPFPVRIPCDPCCRLTPGIARRAAFPRRNTLRSTQGWQRERDNHGTHNATISGHNSRGRLRTARLGQRWKRRNMSQPWPIANRPTDAPISSPLESEGYFFLNSTRIHPSHHHTLASCSPSDITALCLNHPPRTGPSPRASGPRPKSSSTPPPTTSTSPPPRSTPFGSPARASRESSPTAPTAKPHTSPRRSAPKSPAPRAPPSTRPASRTCPSWRARRTSPSGAHSP